MFGFSLQKRRRVQAILTKRVNERCTQEMYGGSGERGPNRMPMAKAMVVVPSARKDWDFENAFIAISRDISSTGMSICHSRRLEGEVLVEIPGENSSTFARMAVQHSTEIGHGYWQVGMKAEEVVELDHADYSRLQERYAKIQDTLALV